MRLTRLLVLGVSLASSMGVGRGTAVDAPDGPASGEVCPRSRPGTLVPEPKDLRSENGVLRADLTVRNERQKDGSTRYCYLLADGSESPTLPGTGRELPH